MKMQGLSNDLDVELSTNVRLLVVDDDAFLRTKLCQQLVSEGFNEVFEASTLFELFEKLPDVDPHLILLDVCLPDGNGMEICRKLRECGFDKPIVMLTGPNLEGDIVAGLEAGANDCVVKPIRVGELLARVRLQLSQHETSDKEKYSIFSLSFFPTNKLLKSVENGKRVVLTEKEAKILKYLCGKYPTGVTKEELLTEVWEFQVGLSTHTVETHIYRLRQKIRRICKKPVILTTQTGYSLASLS